MNAAELDADLWLDRARDLCGHREALVDQLKSLGTQLQTANPDEAASLRPKSHALLRELREAACHVCEAAQQYRDACRNPDAPLAYKDEDYLAKMAHDLDFMGESEALVAAIGTPRRLLRNNPLMLPRPLRAAELDAEDAPPKNAEQARLRRAEALLVGASIAHRNPKAPSSLDMMIEDQGSSLDALSPQPEEEEEEEEVVSRTPPKPATPKPQFANQPSNVNDDWVREAHAQLKELREAQAQLPLERGDPELAAMNNNPALERFKPVLEGKKRAPPRQKKLVELSTEGAYADPDARSYVAPPPRKAKKHQNRHRAQIVDKLERLRGARGLAPANKDGRPPAGPQEDAQEEGTAVAGRDARARRTERDRPDGRRPRGHRGARRRAERGREEGWRMCPDAHVSGRPVPAGRVWARNKTRRRPRRHVTSDPRRRREERRAALQARAPSRLLASGGLARRLFEHATRGRRCLGSVGGLVLAMCRPLCGRGARVGRREQRAAAARKAARGARRRLVPVGPVFPQHDAARHDQTARAAAQEEGRTAAARDPTPSERRGVLQERARDDGVVVALRGGVDGVPRERRGAVIGEGQLARAPRQGLRPDARRRRVRVGPRRGDRR